MKLQSDRFAASVRPAADAARSGPGRTGVALRWLACGLLGLAGSAQAGLISVDFGDSFYPSALYSGVESQAAAAAAAFGAANVWNRAELTTYNAAAVTDPQFTGLKDSAGNSTAVSLAFTGALKAFSFADFFGVTPVDALRHDMFFFNSGNNPAGSVDWAISGLEANREYRFYAYGVRADSARLFDMLVDSNGDGSLADEVAQAIGSTGSDMQHYQDAYFASVFADAGGVIHGRGVGRPDQEANWGGFQLVEASEVQGVPEPASLSLAGLALLGVLAARRRVAVN